MLSPFLKKLLFVRQFTISEGKIEILGEQHVMLPATAVAQLQNEKTFTIINKEIRSGMENYAKKIGASTGGMIKSVQDIYETMGLGKMHILILDADKKETLLRITDVNLSSATLVAGVLSGFFAFLFKKELTEKNVTIKKQRTYLEVTIK